MVNETRIYEPIFVALKKLKHSAWVVFVDALIAFMLTSLKITSRFSRYSDFISEKINNRMLWGADCENLAIFVKKGVYLGWTHHLGSK